jgi:hypothetical protein
VYQTFIEGAMVNSETPSKRSRWKRRFERVLRIPVLGYILALIIAFFRLPRIDKRLTEVRRTLRPVVSDRGASGSDGFILAEEAWRRHIPALLNAASSVGAMGFELRRQKAATESDIATLAAKIDEALQRIEALESLVKPAAQLVGQNSARDNPAS